MADLTPQMRALIDNMRNLVLLYEKQNATTLELLECALWEVKNSRPFNYTGYRDDYAARDRRRQVLIQTLEKVLEAAGRDLQRLRSARDPASNTGD